MITAQHLCLSCSLQAERRLPLFREAIEFAKGGNSTIWMISNTPAVRGLEAGYWQNANNVFNRAAVTPLGNALVEKFNAAKMDLRLFYEFPLDERGRSPVWTTAPSRPTAMERDPHLLYGFFTAFANELPTIYLSDSQYYFFGIYTAVHEMAHLFDAATAAYLSVHQNQWGPLDDFALEFRAVYAEVVQYIQLQSVAESKYADAFLNLDFYEGLRSGQAVNAEGVIEYVKRVTLPRAHSDRRQIRKAYSYTGAAGETTLLSEAEGSADLFAAILKLLNAWQPEKQLSSDRVFVLQDVAISGPSPAVQDLGALARNRGALGVQDYLKKNGLMRPITLLDQGYNQLPRPKGRDGGD